MRKLALLGLVAGLLIVMSGCKGDSPAPNPAGPEANSGKTYTKEDATAAVPKRNGSGE